MSLFFYNRFKQKEGEERQEKGKVLNEKEQIKAIRCVSDQSDPIWSVYICNIVIRNT